MRIDREAQALGPDPNARKKGENDILRRAREPGIEEHNVVPFENVLKQVPVCNRGSDLVNPGEDLHRVLLPLDQRSASVYQQHAACHIVRLRSTEESKGFRYLLGGAEFAERYRRRCSRPELRIRLVDMLTQPGHDNTRRDDVYPYSRVCELLCHVSRQCLYTGF